VIVELVLVVALLGAITAPHLLPLHAISPRTAGSIWFCALALRALTALGGAIFVFVYLPRTELFRATAEWCWHAIVPLLRQHLGLSGHPFADAATVVPGLALAGSLLWVLFGIARAGLAIRLHLRHRARGTGPLGSTVVDDREIVVAVTGLRRARIVVSEAALAALDEDELRAGLTHELGHIERRHRPISLLAVALAALGRWLPGTRAAERELAFCLERDADEYAVSHTRDPLALASAICKAATAHPRLALTGLAGRGRLALRLDHLLDCGERRARHGLERSMRLVAALMVALALLLAVTLPGWALAAPASPVDADLIDCPH
jgi:Zn-dependent protease with chaperone function